MERKLLLFIVLFMSFTSSYTQSMDWKTGLITFESGDSPGSEVAKYVKYGEFSSFTITNINRFLYSVTIAGKRVELETPVPTELQTLFRLPRTDLEATANNDAVGRAASAVNTQGDQVAKFTPAMRKGYKSSNPALTAIGINDAADSFQENYVKFVEAVKKLSVTIETIKVNRVRLVNFAQQDVSYNQMKAEIERLNAVRDPSADYSSMLDYFKKLQDDFDRVGEEGADQSDLAGPLQTAKNTVKVIQDEKPAALYADVDFLYNELQNANNFIAVAPPVQADGDYVNYKIAVIPSRTNTLGAYKSPTSFDFDIPVKGGWKTDFSVGPTFSFGNDSRDDKYFFETSANEGKVILKKGKNENITTPGLAAMMHFYRRSGTDFNWGGMLGVGAGFQNLNDADLSFYGGVSGVLGKRQKIMVSCGYSFLNVERIKSGQYKVDGEYSSTTNLSDVTEKVIKGSFFFSVSYNLTNRLEK